MPKIFTVEEKNMVRRLHNEGSSFVEIADKMAALYPDNWATKSAARAVAKVVKNEEQEEDESTKTLDEMGREERFKHISTQLRTSPRFSLTFDTFNDRERNMFVDEYLKIMKSIDSITEAEEQTLYSTVLEWMLAIQALGRKQREERYYEDSLAGVIGKDHITYRPRGIDDRYQKEYDQHMKLYHSGYKQLKMSREQRLKEIRSDRRTLTDLAEEFSTKSAQADAATEIQRLSTYQDDELKKMLENGYIKGIFED